MKLSLVNQFCSGVGPLWESDQMANFETFFLNLQSFEKNLNNFQVSKKDRVDFTRFMFQISRLKVKAKNVYVKIN